MDWKFYFLLLCIFPFSQSFDETNWNLLLFIGNKRDSLFFNSFETQMLRLSNTLFVPKILYFLNESQLNLLAPLKRPFYLKSRNAINSNIILDELESISLVSDNFERILTPKMHPIIYKDEEKVAFHVMNWTEDEIRSILKSFGKLLKYKLVFSYKNLPKINSPHIFTSCEFCKSKDNVFPIKLPRWTDFERSFEGTSLHITTPTGCSSRLNFNFGPDGKYRMVSGLLMYFVQYIQKKMNFTVSFKVAGRGGGTGIKLSNGTWNGVISEVLNGEVDIGMCTAETYSRSFSVGFTPAVIVEPVVFVSGPPHKIFAWKAIFWPFSSEVWSFLAGIILVSVLMMRFSYAILKTPKEKRWASNKALGFILGILLGNTGRTPTYAPLTIKFYVVIWLLSGSIITTAYLSKLIGFLTFPQLEKVPETAEELVESKYKWGLTYLGGALYSLIKGTKIKAYENLVSKMELRSDTLGCLQQTLDSKYICISYEIITQFYMKGRTDIKQNPFTYPNYPFVTIPVGIVMEKRAVFGPSLKAAVRSSDAAGLNSFWEEHDVREVRQAVVKLAANPKPDLVKQDDNTTEDKRSLTVQHLRGAFTAFVAGLLVAQIVFILEKVVFCTSRVKNDSQIHTIIVNSSHSDDK